MDDAIYQTMILLVSKLDTELISSRIFHHELYMLQRLYLLGYSLQRHKFNGITYLHVKLTDRLAKKTMKASLYQPNRCCNLNFDASTGERSLLCTSECFLKFVVGRSSGYMVSRMK